MSEQYLSVSVEQVAPAVTVLTPIGEIDRDSSPALAEAAEPPLDADGCRLIVDLSGVTFCDSAGINLLFRLHRRVAARGGAVSVAGARGIVLQALTVINMSRMLSMHPTLDEAVREATA
ncbi:hypothetical protein Acy02nite_32210 [Actinoplanes cyaneus]|uniref:Anti-sigma factor antagonist n=1 Tax=Actinoplanes cyaneus TaxID=52696 RepID=A0A919IG07_9ACTN|nr:STAS domain-containing protein [Actinoplanes cyaneus]MCW2142534.1 anti-anti-sigma factor [Actinoplanes cyaneus]GID65340.1 hypothetical protein Acy02nite_32210 [Actinoplanes cyaneus]